MVHVVTLNSYEVITAVYYFEDTLIYTASFAKEPEKNFTRYEAVSFTYSQNQYISNTYLNEFTSFSYVLELYDDGTVLFEYINIFYGSAYSLLRSTLTSHEMFPYTYYYSDNKVFIKNSFNTFSLTIIGETLTYQGRTTSGILVYTATYQLVQ